MTALAADVLYRLSDARWLTMRITLRCLLRADSLLTSKKSDFGSIHTENGWWWWGLNGNLSSRGKNREKCWLGPSLGDDDDDRCWCCHRDRKIIYLILAFAEIPFLRRPPPPPPYVLSVIRESSRHCCYHNESGEVSYTELLLLASVQPKIFDCCRSGGFFPRSCAPLCTPHEKWNFSRQNTSKRVRTRERKKEAGVCCREIPGNNLPVVVMESFNIINFSLFIFVRSG